MASIVNRNSLTTSHPLVSKDKKLSKSARISTLNFENELMLKNSYSLNISTKSINSRASLIHSSNNPQNLNNFFKLNSPTTPTLLSPNPKKQNSIILFHTDDYTSDSDSESEINSAEPCTPRTPRTSNRTLNLNINSLLKDIKALNFKYRNRAFFDSNSTLKESQENLDKLEQSLLNKDTDSEKTLIDNSDKNEMDSGKETMVASSNDSLNTAMSSLAADFQTLILKSPTPPPTSKLPDIPPPTRPAPHYLPPPPPLPKEEINLGAFDIIKTIGTGSFGRVHLVLNHSNKKYYAMKAIPKQHIAKEQQIEHIQEEKQILSELRHPLFIHLLGTFQTRTHLFIVTNYIAGGELFAVLKKKIRFANNVAKFYAAEVTIALEYLHSKDIIYRDLKPENIMLDITGHIKLVDLGFAKHVPDVTYTLCGTPEYMAPEVILTKPYGKAVDWYALGILIYEMLCGYPPFYDQDQLKLYKKILTGKIYWPSYVI